MLSEKSRTRKDQSFFVPVQEIRENGYDLTINKYKEVERETKTYRSSSDILADIKTQRAITDGLLEEIEVALSNKGE